MSCVGPYIYFFAVVVCCCLLLMLWLSYYLASLSLVYVSWSLYLMCFTVNKLNLHLHLLELRSLTQESQWRTYICLPSHLFVPSFRRCPAGHLHSNEPTVLMQFPPWHRPGIAWHSSTSVQRIRVKACKNPLLSFTVKSMQ